MTQTPGIFTSTRQALHTAACVLVPIAVFVIGATGFFVTAPWYLAALVLLLLVLLLVWGLVG